jgi:Transglycosylase SLT domain
MKMMRLTDGCRARHRNRGLGRSALLVVVASFFDIGTAFAENGPFNTPLVWEPAPAASATSVVQSPPSAKAPLSVPSPPLSLEPGPRPPYDSLIATTAAEFGLDAQLLHAIVRIESGYDASAFSPKGAVGLMQVMPATGKRFGFTDLEDPRTNLSAGAAYLRWLLERFGNNLELALAAYNAGEHAVERYGPSVPPYRETREYVANVVARYRALQQQPRASEAPMARAPQPARSYANGRTGGSPTPLQLLEKLGSLMLSAPPSRPGTSGRTRTTRPSE